MLRTPPDGQSLLFVANRFVIDPSLHRAATYDPLRDFALHRPEVRAMRQDQGFEIPGLDASAFAARIRHDEMACAAVVKAAAVTAD